ncbi:MAG: flavin reductase family protein [Candidatus Omnitrophota bacterium]|nr:MAG: flavin reductase family protein [Candidatus Omnitrophota bacterium]
MKISVAKEKATRLLNCGMVVLVSCAYKDKQNVTTCAWHQPLSKAPAAVAVALAKKHFSSELIRKSEEFIINIPDWFLLDKVVQCGSLSGWDADKFKATGLTPAKPKKLIKSPVIKEGIGSVECSLIDLKEVGDHFLFLGEVIYAEADSDCFVNDIWDTTKVDLIFHLGAKFFFKSSPYSEFKR